MSEDRLPGGIRLRTALTDELAVRDLDAIRALMHAAFDHGIDRFSDDDWAHALGGRHFLLEEGPAIVGHASVVEREIHVGGRPMRTGFVEAVAIEPARQGGGLGSVVMNAVDDHIQSEYELGALGTGRHSFYERLGWRRWRGPLFVRTAAGDRPTPDDDDILVLATPTTPFALDPDASLSCDDRPGDPW